MDLETERPFVLAPARYVLLPLANLITGYSVKAMERKIERGDWVEALHQVKGELEKTIERKVLLEEEVR
jgi:hypothetical protein